MPTRIMVKSAVLASSILLFSLVCVSICNARVKPDYPDAQELILESGKVEIEWNIKGSVTISEGTRKETTTADIKASTTITGDSKTYSGEEKIRGEVVVEYKSDKFPITNKHSFDSSQPIESKSSSNTMPVKLLVSRKMGAAYLPLPFVIPGFYELEEINVRTTLSMGNPQTSVTQEEKARFFSSRIPFYGGGESAFSEYAKRVESSGKEDDLPLMDGAYMEVPWADGGSQGSYTVPVLALVTSVGVVVNTAPAMKATYASKPDSPLIPGTMTVKWSLGKLKPQNSMEIYPADTEHYNQWLPVPGDSTEVDFGTAVPIEFVAELKPSKDGEQAPKGKIDFYLLDVSSHNGRCNNYPNCSVDEKDLRFSKQQPAGIILDPSDPSHAYTDGSVSRASVIIEALDTAAYGKLKAVCEELNLVAKYKRTGADWVDIPRDDDGDHVADFWEEMHGVSARSADWDGETVEGHKADGDAMSLHTEYRGFVTLENGKHVFKRMNPLKKELFVIDPDRALRFALWEQATQIVPVMLDDSLVLGGDDPDKSRIADANGQGQKYSLRIEVIKGMVNPKPVEGEDPKAKEQFAYCYGDQTNAGSSFIRIFPDRFRAQLDRAAGALFIAITDPDSKQAAAVEKAGIPKWMAQKALEGLDEANRNEMVKKLMTVSVIHEVGHACGLEGHLGEDGNGEHGYGDKQCYMQYPDDLDYLRIDVLQLLFKPDADTPLVYNRFCRGDQGADIGKAYNCFGQLNVKK